MSKNKAKPVDSQLKASLKQLHKLGLYDPKNPRKAPTRYGKSLVKKYTDIGVLGNKPRASVVKVPTSVAQNLKGEYRVKKAKKGSRVIVPNRAGTRTFYSRKNKTIVRTTKSWNFTFYKDHLIFMRPVAEWPPSPPDDFGFEEDDEHDEDFSDFYRRVRSFKTEYPFAFPRGNGFKIYYNQDEIIKDMHGDYNPTKTTLWQFPHLARKK